MAKRFRRGRRNFRAARSFIRRTVTNMGPIVAKKVLFIDQAIPDFTSTAFDNPLNIPLLVAQENTNAEQGADGTNPAETTIHSRLVAIKLRMSIRPTGS